MFNIIEFIELDSTNKFAKQNIEKLNNRDVIFTTIQNKGKGRMLRDWISNSNSLTFSIVLKDSFSISNFDVISLLSACAVFKALSKYIKNNLSIKWPNDIYVNDKKICGILLESISYSSSIEGIIVGIGVNVNNKMDELSATNNNSTSIYSEINQIVSIKQLLNEILIEFDDLLLKVKNGNKEYFSIIKENNYLKGKTAYAHFSSIEGEVKVLDVLENNKLLVLFQDEKITLDTGEITFHKEN